MITAGTPSNSITVTAGAAGENGDITVTATNSCGTSAQSSLAVTVNQMPVLNVTNALPTVCSGASTGIILTSNLAGTTYNWTATASSINVIGYSNPGSVIGAGANSAFTIAESLTSIANPIPPPYHTVTYTVTPSNSGCTGLSTPVSVQVFFVPNNTMKATPLAQTVCNQNANTSIIFTDGFTSPPIITIYDWVNDTPAIGLASSGSGDINFTAVNATGSPVTATITVTPVSFESTLGIPYCSGNPVTVTITVNPSPQAFNVTGSGSYCLGGTGRLVGLSGSFIGVNYQLLLNGNPVVGAVLPGTGNALDFGLQTAGTYTVVATGPGVPACSVTMTGSAVITIDNPPTFNPPPPPSTGTVCTGGNILINITSPGGNTMSWTSDNSANVTVTPASGTVTPSGIIFQINPGVVNLTSIPQDVNITVITTSAAGCSRTDIYTRTVNPATTITTQPINATVCPGGTTSFMVAATGVGLTYLWQVSTIAPWSPPSYVPAVGGVYSNPTPDNLTITGALVGMSTYHYRCIVTGTCGAPTSNVVILTVPPQPTITLGANPSVCSGATTANLPYSAVSGFPNKYSIVYSAAALGAGFINVTNAAFPVSPIVLVVPVAAPPATYTAILTVQNAAGCVSIGYPISVTVSSPSVGGTVASDAAFCNVVNSGTLSLSGQTGSVIRWEFSTNGGTSWTPIANTTATQTYTNLTLTTLYRAVVQSGACAQAISSIATRTIAGTLSPGAHNTTPLTECAGFNPDDLTFLTVPSGGLPPYTYVWQLNNVAIVPAETGSSYNPPAIIVAGTYSYNCQVTDACGTIVYTAPKVIIIIADPTVTITGPTEVCQYASALLTANVTNGLGTITYKWKSGPAIIGPWAIIPGETGQTYLPPTGVAGTFYYQVVASASGAGCDDASASVTFIVNPLPTTSLIYHQ